MIGEMIYLQFKDIRALNAGIKRLGDKTLWNQAGMEVRSDPVRRQMEDICLDWRPSFDDWKKHLQAARQALRRADTQNLVGQMGLAEAVKSPVFGSLQKVSETSKHKLFAAMAKPLVESLQELHAELMKQWEKYEEASSGFLAVLA